MSEKFKRLDDAGQADEYLEETVKRLRESAAPLRRIQWMAERSHEMADQAAWNWNLATSTVAWSKRSNDRFDPGIDADGAIWDWDCMSGQVTYNEICAESYGWSDSKVSFAEWWLDHVQADDCMRIRNSLKTSITGQADRWTAYCRLRMRDGSYVYVYNWAYLFRDASGRLQRVVGAILEQSERKLETNELGNMTEKLVISNGQPDPFLNQTI